MSLTQVATYTRRIHGPLAGVWENVFDWEHLPWLHRESFSSIACLGSGTWGWRARVGLRPARPDDAITIELVVEQEAGRYVTRTTAGTGAGSEIWTRLEPVDAAATDIEVGFHLPDVDPARADAIGAAYATLYARLWDQDEAMIQRRARLRRTPAEAPVRGTALDLGLVDNLRARLPLRVDPGNGTGYRLVEVDGELVAHATRCPHMQGPLDDVEVRDGCITCPWHGYRFDVRTGRQRGGRGLRLAPAPRVAIDPESSGVRLLFE